METQRHHQLFEQAEPIVATVAAAGLRGWRAEPIDIETLGELLLVREQFAAMWSESESDVDARRDAVEAALIAALKRLPEPFFATASAHLGAEDTSEKPKKKQAREEEAVAALDGKTHRWYVDAGRSPKFFDKTPSEYVIGLVTAALWGRRSVTFLARHHAPQDRPQVRSRAVAAALLAAGAVVVIAVVALATSGGSMHAYGANQAPPRGWAVDKQTGKAVPPSALPSRAPRASKRLPALIRTGQLAGGGDIFHSCLASSPSCPTESKSRAATYVKPGDRILLRLEIYLSKPPTIPEVHVVIHDATMPNHTGTTLTANIEWQHLPYDPAPEGTAIIRFRDSRPHRLRYATGSAALYDSFQEGGPEGHLVARLPEGLFSFGGIALTNVGIPANGCQWNCYAADVRYLDFEMIMV